MKWLCLLHRAKCVTTEFLQLHFKCGKTQISMPHCPTAFPKKQLAIYHSFIPETRNKVKMKQINEANGVNN